MKKAILSLCLLSSVASAAKLENVKILNLVPGQGSLQLKIQAKEGPRGSYFLLDIAKNDPESFDKLIHIMKKMMYKDKYKLDLDIPSFSASPSGSYYKSDRATFHGTLDSEPSGFSSPKRKNKKPL